MFDISIVIPFLNEEGNIPNLITALNNYFSENTSISTEVILVDDGSTDNSIAILKQQKIHGYTLKLISLSKNFGSHAAVRAGTLKANGNYIIFLPADLQDPLTLIHTCYKTAVEQNTDIVYAFRQETNNGLFETIFSKFYAFCMRKFVVSNFPDKGFDIVFFSKKIKEELNKNIESNSSIQLQILNLGFSSIDIFYSKKERKIGKSKWTISKKIKMVIDSFVAFSYAPIRFVSLVGVLFFIIGIFWTFYIVSRKIFYNDIAPGWPMLTSILFLGFGITNIALGIIAEYLWRTLDASRNRPVFIIDEIIELNNNFN